MVAQVDLHRRPVAQQQLHAESEVQCLPPLVEEVRTRNLDAAALECEDIKQFLAQQEKYDPVLWDLRQAADLLCVYEKAVRPNPIATLERIICLGSLTIFFYMATRGRTWAGLPARPLLLQAIGKFESPIARASEQSVQELIVSDSKRYLIALLRALVEPLGSQRAITWFHCSIPPTCSNSFQERCINVG